MQASNYLWAASGLCVILFLYSASQTAAGRPGRGIKMRSNRKSSLLAALVLAHGLLLHAGCLHGEGEEDMKSSVIRLCREYLEGFGSGTTNLVYHHRLNGPDGLNALSSPDEISKGQVRGKDMPFGYGSGIQDVALENGHFLLALCDAYEATGEEYFAQTAKHVFSGMKRVATLSPVPGFVPRGPHPDGKSYYRNSSMDQHTTFVYALWRFSRSPLASAEDRRFIADVLEKVARRMEKNGWAIRVEDDSQVAHVGFCWLQHTCIGSEILLSFLAAVYEATGNGHWLDLYRQFSEEKDAVRWQLLRPDHVVKWPCFTLYSNQFAVGLAVLCRAETDEAHRAMLRETRKRLAEKMFTSNVFGEQNWRRLDWADEWSAEGTEAQLKPFGLSLSSETTVFDLYRRFDPALLSSPDRTRRQVNNKLCFGLPTVAVHAALLSCDKEAAQKAAPVARDMIGKMLAHGRLYTDGENFNRAVAISLHLVADENGFDEDRPR